MFAIPVILERIRRIDGEAIESIEKDPIVTSFFQDDNVL